MTTSGSSAGGLADLADDSRTVVDLTLEISNGMPAHSLFPSPIVLPFVTHEDARAAGLGTSEDPMTYAVNWLASHDHVSTHVDAFRHINPAGATIDEMPLQLFMGRATCLDLRHIPDLGDIDAGDLERAEQAADVKIDGHIVLICSGFHNRHWPEREVVTQNPGLTAAATHWLADRGSRAHGVEGPSTDRAGNREFPNHRVCRDRGLTHYEWLVNLEQLVGKGEFAFAGLPLKMLNGTGSPVRAVAFVDERRPLGGGGATA